MGSLIGISLQMHSFFFFYVLTLLLRNQIIEERSFVPCEELRYGRISFKGFNPEVEVGFTFSLFYQSYLCAYFLLSIHYLLCILSPWCVTHFCVMLNITVYLYVPVQDVLCIITAGG